MHPHVHCTLFTIAKTRKQPKCPLTDEWIKKMWYIYTMEYSVVLKIMKYTTVNAGEGVEKREPSFTVGGNVNWYNHYGKQYGGTSES